jgi:hypothetical protein
MDGDETSTAWRSNSEMIRLLERGPPPRSSKSVLCALDSDGYIAPLFRAFEPLCRKCELSPGSLACRQLVLLAVKL